MNNCSEAVAYLVYQGFNCATDLGQLSSNLTGYTAKDICCETCSAAEGQFVCLSAFVICGLLSLGVFCYFVGVLSKSVRRERLFRPPTTTVIAASTEVPNDGGSSTTSTSYSGSGSGSGTTAGPGS